MKRMLAGALALAATSLGSGITLVQPAHASTSVAIRPVPETIGFHLAVTRVLPAHADLDPVLHTVRTGESLAGLAVTFCHGKANDWTGFYDDNRKTIGSNPNLIYPGQVLNLARCTDPPKLLHLGSTYRAPHRAAQRAVSRVVSRSGKIWGVTYGYPNKCGDGDGDGWDVACSSPRPATRTFRRVQRSFSTRTYAGSYSRAGLEQLWVSAGGPGWAASAAAAVAECESGGNPNAYNPSGATGLWQILGAVIGGDLRNPMVNAENAVSKFRASGQTWAQWVCKP